MTLENAHAHQLKCRGWRGPCGYITACCLYWHYDGAEHFWTQIDLCVVCAEQAAEFFYKLPGGLQGEYRFSMQEIDVDD